MHGVFRLHTGRILAGWIEKAGVLIEGCFSFIKTRLRLLDSGTEKQCADQAER
jgi:hypothetical protein